MPHHDSHASGSLDNSGCKRLRISSLVDDMAEEEIQKYLLCASGGELVDELRSKGFQTNIWETMLTRAFNEESVAALHTVIGLMRQKLDALQGGPAPAAPSPPAAPPANSAPAVNSVDPAASLRPSLAARPAPPPPEPFAAPPRKRRRTVPRTSSAGAPRQSMQAFQDAFAAFAFEYGQVMLKRDGNLHQVSDTMIYDAFKASATAQAHLDYFPAQMHHYFCRQNWINAVISDDP